MFFVALFELLPPPQSLRIDLRTTAPESTRR